MFGYRLVTTSVPRAIDCASGTWLQACRGDDDDEGPLDEVDETATACTTLGRREKEREDA